MRLSKLYFGIIAGGLATGIIFPMLPLVMPMMVTKTDVLTAVAWIAVAFSFLGYISVLAHERGKRRWWMISGLATGSAAFIVWTWAVVFSLRYSDFIVATWTSSPLTGWALLMAFA